MEADGMMRLDKFLAKMGAGSRQEVKSYIRKGMVSVNGETVSRPETKIDEEKDEIFLQGKRIAYAAFEYYMLNKPAGVISATEDKKETTVVDLIREKKRKDLFPVGRLDKDTEGLLLITNDGVLAHRLLSPNHHVDKTYFVRVHGRVTEEEEKSFLAGVNIGTGDEEEWTRPARLEILKSGEESEVRLDKKLLFLFDRPVDSSGQLFLPFPVGKGKMHLPDRSISLFSPLYLESGPFFVLPDNPQKPFL